MVSAEEANMGGFGENTAQPSMMQTTTQSQRVSQAAAAPQPDAGGWVHGHPIVPLLD